MELTTKVITATVKFSVEGFHNWPNAPETRKYLADKHRHMFYVNVTIQVVHTEREIEFHDLLDFCKENFPGGDMGASSCETMAEQLANKITLRYSRRVTVSVFEDDEVGATVTYQ